jgi:hypothetical protein
MRPATGYTSEIAVVAVGDQKMDVWATAEEALGNVAFYVGQVTESGPRRVRSHHHGLSAYQKRAWH